MARGRGQKTTRVLADGQGTQGDGSEKNRVGVVRGRRTRDSGSIIVLSSPSSVTAYVDELRRLLRTGVRARRRITREVEEHLLDAVAADEDCSSLESIIVNFGTPEEVSSQFNAFARQTRSRNVVVGCAAICGAVVIGYIDAAHTSSPVSPQAASRPYVIVFVNPQSGRRSPTAHRLVGLDPRSGRVLAPPHR